MSSGENITAFVPSRAYVDWIRRFILYDNKRHPRVMAEAEVSDFLTHLARSGNVSASTQNQAFSALLFFTKGA